MSKHPISKPIVLCPHVRAAYQEAITSSKHGPVRRLAEMTEQEQAAIKEAYPGQTIARRCPRCKKRPPALRCTLCRRCLNLAKKRTMQWRQAQEDAARAAPGPGLAEHRARLVEAIEATREQPTKQLERTSPRRKVAKKA